MKRTKATKLDKEIQEGLYDPKKPATIYVITDARGNRRKATYAEWLKWMKEQKKLYDPLSLSKILTIAGALLDPKQKQSDYKKFESARLSAYTKSLGSVAKAKSAIRKAWLAYKRKERDTAMRLNDPKKESRKAYLKRLASGKTRVPKRWFYAMVQGIKKSSDVRNPYAIVRSIWDKLSPSKRLEIKRREEKGERFKYDLPLPVDKPTKGIGTVRMVKPFKLAEVQVNLSVADYLTALKSGIFSRMKRQDGTTALVARCKSPEKNVNIFVDKAGGK